MDEHIFCFALYVAILKPVGLRFPNNVPDRDFPPQWRSERVMLRIGGHPSQPPPPQIGGEVTQYAANLSRVTQKFSPQTRKFALKIAFLSKISKISKKAIYYTSILLFFSCLFFFIQLLMGQRVTQKFLLLEMLLVLQFYISRNQYTEFSYSNFCVSPPLA